MLFLDFKAMNENLKKNTENTSILNVFSTLHKTFMYTGQFLHILATRLQSIVIDVS
jgi:hypothetical protein